MSTIFSKTDSPIAFHDRPHLRVMTFALVEFGHRLRVLMRTVGGKLGRQFANFARVPYPDPIYQQQWEQMWEAEPVALEGKLITSI